MAALVAAYPQGARVRRLGGELPLDLAVRSLASSRVQELLAPR